MSSEHQAYCHQVYRNFRFFLGCVALLMIIVQSLARGEDRILFSDSSSGSLIAQGTLPAVEPGRSFAGLDKAFQPGTGSTTTRSGDSFRYNLTAGWNLISINLNLDARSKALLLSKGAMTLEASRKAYVFSGDLAASQACWIYCHEAEEISLSGTPLEEFDFAARLKHGWNFVGPLYDCNLPSLGTIAWCWNGQCFYQANALRAGLGYYLYWSSEYIVPPKDTYLIIDLSAGPEATSYPVSYRSTPPAYGWTDEYKTTKLVLRKIPAGVFMMGSPENELGRYGAETRHRVTLTKNFYIGVFEVTQKQWERVMGNWPSHFKNESYRDTRPVEMVGYSNIRGSTAGSCWPANNLVDADSFMGRLRAKTRLTFDLPTEAQWEYACRASAATALNSGKDLTDEKECPNLAELGRYKGNGGTNSTADDTSYGTNTVGCYTPNQWGLYDMHGNVWEWCLDWSQDDLGSSAQTDPRGAADGSFRVCRGGSWSGIASYCRSAARGWISPSFTLNIRGFRLVSTIP
ncbi:MAG: formylglycine-generating enzyme family protein [Lentisphaeria bacterium]|jgi:formylglycine-generating enzyme required for sulfatase activity